MAKKMKAGVFDFNDFIAQAQEIRELGAIEHFLKLPGE